MNSLNFNQSVGFPLETEILDEMQKAYTIFNALGFLAGNFSIISGCETVGTTVANGVVFINGELLPFLGGTITANVIIVEAVQMREFEDGSEHNVIYTRHVTFGTATTQWAWNTFKRGAETTTIESRLAVLEAKNAVFQSGGGMVLWQKPVGLIPAGWAEVVDWQERMPVGYKAGSAEFGTMGQTGGAKTHTLTEGQLPIISPINGTAIKKFSTSGGTVGITVSDYSGGDFAPGELIKPFGGGLPHAILSPYRVCAFIEWVGL